MSKKKIGNELTKEQFERLLKNEFQMDSVGTDTMEIPLVEPKPQDVTDSSDENIIENKVEEVEYNDIEFPTRGHENLESAIAFMHSKDFSGLSELGKQEYTNWLIKK